MLRQRVARVREEIKRELTDILRKMKDPRIGFVTVTDVEVSNDLRYVKAFVSVLGDEEAKRQSMKGLESATGFVRTEIGRRIRLRHTPEITFKFDPSIERGARINELIAGFRSNETVVAPPAAEPAAGPGGDQEERP